MWCAPLRQLSTPTARTAKPERFRCFLTLWSPCALTRLKEEFQPKPTDRLFTVNGAAWRSWLEAFDGAVERAGIENFHFDDLRQCYGSWLAIKGVPFENRQKLMRHKDPKMTIRYSSRHRVST